MHALFMKKQLKKTNYSLIDEFLGNKMPRCIQQQAPVRESRCVSDQGLVHHELRTEKKGKLWLCKMSKTNLQFDFQSGKLWKINQWKQWHIHSPIDGNSGKKIFTFPPSVWNTSWLKVSKPLSAPHTSCACNLAVSRRAVCVLWAWLAGQLW